MNRSEEVKPDYFLPLHKQARERMDKGHSYREFFHSEDGVIEVVMRKESDPDPDEHIPFHEDSKMVGINFSSFDGDFNWSRMVPEHKGGNGDTMVVSDEETPTMAVTSYETAKEKHGDALSEQYVKRMDFNTVVYEVVEQIEDQLVSMKEQKEKATGQDASIQALAKTVAEELFEKISDNDKQTKKMIDDLHQTYNEKYSRRHPNQPVDLGGMVVRDRSVIEDLQDLTENNPEGEQDDR